MIGINKIKSYLSKFKFLIKTNPKIKSSKNFRKYIPQPYQSVLLISSDFELAWAWRYEKSNPNAIINSLEKAKIERENIPKILNLCEQFNIPITWATVGHLFLEKCDKIHNEIPTVPNYDGPFWNFNGKDWFEYDPGTDSKSNPEWYCPELINLIITSTVKHEIGNHTFSHIDCRDGICPPDLLRAELIESKKLAEKFGVNLKSFVHPGHTIGNLDVLAEQGFTNFRTDYKNVLGYPQKHQNGLWELEQTAEFNIRKEWSIDYHILRYIKIIKRAIKSNTVAVFWFHPSFSTDIIEKIWPSVFEYLDKNRDKLWITTHSEYVYWLNNIQK